MKEVKRKSKSKMEEKPMDFLDSFTIEGPRGPRGAEEITDKKFKYKVKVTHPALRVRRAPNTQAEVIDLITDQGIYTITDEVNGWGQLENGYWIMLSYTQIV